MLLAVGASMDFRTVMAMNREEQDILLSVLKEKAEAMNPNRTKKMEAGPGMMPGAM